MNLNENELLRFTTAGSVDDGKSTLIGRLLYDSKSIFEDQLEAVKTSSEKKGFDYIDLSLLTDGLRSEREQGITIDVAYRYFTTPKRKFIIADTPGHIQYTRNMVTGASTANLAIILIDARKGLVEQTYRHAYIASLLKIPHLVVCVNKMDLVEFDQDVYTRIVADFEAFSSKLEIRDIQYVPISALFGDNVVDRSEKTPWYNGGTLLHILETVHIGSDHNHIDFRFPVQWVIRPQTLEHQDYRGYAGRVASGVVKKGDKVVALPSGFESTVSSIDFNGQSLGEAYAPMSVTIKLEDEIDIGRGDMIVHADNPSEQSQEINVMLCWMNQRKATIRNRYILKHTSAETKAILKEIQYTVDINTMEQHAGDAGSVLNMNDIARVQLRTANPLFFDSYNKCRQTGSVILIDEGTYETVAAGMIV